jgi:hypothetical protein
VTKKCGYFDTEVKRRAESDVIKLRMKEWESRARTEKKHGCIFVHLFGFHDRSGCMFRYETWKERAGKSFFFTNQLNMGPFVLLFCFHDFGFSKWLAVCL